MKTQDLEAKRYQDAKDRERLDDLTEVTPFKDFGQPSQPTHSPLPWQDTKARHGFTIASTTSKDLIAMTRGEDAVDQANARHIVRACNNAERLAEVLSDLADEGEAFELRSVAKAREALAQWEAGL